MTEHPYIDIWCISLTECAALPESVLSPEERLRAARFYFERDARRFRVCRAALRTVLSCRLGQPADTIRLAAGPSGKPFIEGSPSVHFNLSHSGEIALLAVSLEAEVGVDVEAIRPDIPIGEMSSWFTDREQEVLNQAPSATRASVFFTLWTRKEAIIKADGGGLGLGLRNIDVSRAPEELVRVESGVQQLWRVNDLDVAPGYAAAIAGPDGIWHVRRHRFKWG